MTRVKDKWQKRESRMRRLENGIRRMQGKWSRRIRRKRRRKSRRNKTLDWNKAPERKWTYLLTRTGIYLYTETHIC